MHPYVRTVRRTSDDLLTRLKITPLLLLFVLWLETVPAVLAASGDLDPFFGTGGIVKTQFGEKDASGNSMALQADGKFVVVGQISSEGNPDNDDFGVVRYLPTGEVDPAFGAVVTDVGGAQDIAWSVAVQPDGKVVVAGQAASGGRNAIAVVRYTRSGLLDESFGTGGKVITPIGENSLAKSVALQSDGKIVVAGYTNSSGVIDTVVLRYLPDGSLDPDFNGSGIATVDFGLSEIASSVAVQTDGGIVVAGNNSLQTLVMRLTSTGAVDTSFGGGDGFVTTQIGLSCNIRGMVIDLNGRIVLAGQRIGPGQDFLVVRYTSDGMLDSTFAGGAGFVASHIGGGFEGANALAVRRDGSIFVTGVDYNDANGDFELALVRYTDAGALDSSFGNGGAVIAPLGPFFDSGAAVAVQEDGRVLVAGVTSSTLSQIDFVVLRYQGAAPGDLEPYREGMVGTEIYTAVPQPDGKVIIAGSFINIGPLPRRNIARLNADGTLDTGFDPYTNGIVSCVAVQADGKVLVGGSFTELQPNGALTPTPRNRIARLNADGSLDLTFNPNADGTVNCLAVQADGRVLLGGDFTTLQPGNAASPVTRIGIARLNSDGSLDTTFDPRAANVRSIAVQTDSRIVIGGGFVTLSPNGVTPAIVRQRVARLNSDGSVDLSFDPQANGVVACVAVQPNGHILLGGEFTSLQPNGAVSSTSRNRLARVQSDGTLDLVFDPNLNAPVSSLAVQADGKIVIGGAFVSLQPNGAPSTTTRNYVARLNADGTLDPGFDPNADAGVSSVALQGDGRVLLGGTFAFLQPNGAATGIPTGFFARLYNEPAGQQITSPGNAQVVWTRRVSSPELTNVTFEYSRANGPNWTLLGPGLRIGTTPDWQIALPQDLPAGGFIRARGRVAGGLGNGSAGLIEQISAFGAITRVVAGSGGSTVIPGSEQRAVFVGFETPDLDIAKGSVVTDDGKKLDAIFKSSGDVLLRAKQTVMGGPIVNQRLLKQLQPPTGDAVLGKLETGGGITAANDDVLFTGLMSDNPQPMVSEGQTIPNAPESQLGSFISVDGNGPVTFFRGTLKGELAGGRKAVAVFAVGPAPVGFRMLAYKGQVVDGKTVRTVATLVGQARTLTEGRWRAAPNALGVRLTFARGEQALYLIPALADTPADWIPISKTGADADPAIPGALMRSFQLPAYAPDAVVFDSLLQTGVGGITTRNSRAIFDAEGSLGGGAITLRLLAQLRGPSPPQSNFQRFLNTLAGLGRASTIIGNATLNGVNVSRGTIFDAGQDGQLRPIARLGERAPGGGRFERFVSVAKPDGQGYGALVSALLRINGRDGVSSRNRAALYAVDSTGTLRCILRAGDMVESGDSDSTFKPVRSFVSLTPAPSSTGAARGYDENGRVAALVKFDDRSQAVISIQVP